MSTAFNLNTKWYWYILTSNNRNEEKRTTRNNHLLLTIVVVYSLIFRKYFLNTCFTLIHGDPSSLILYCGGGVPNQNMIVRRQLMRYLPSSSSRVLYSISATRRWKREDYTSASGDKAKRYLRFQ